MAESEVHRSMKRIVRGELEEEGYSVIEEPFFSPSRRVHWTNYRPDLVGYLKTESREELAVVECETRPSAKRFRRKNFSSIWFQPYLFCQGGIRRILAVPQGTLPNVDLKLRDQWEVWILGRLGPVCKIGTLKEDRGLLAIGPQTCVAVVT